MLEIKGLDQLQKKLKSMQDNVQKLGGQHHIPVTELLTPKFLARHTSFSTADELFEASGFKIESAEDFSNIPDDAWDAYIQSVSDFDGWQAMLSKATEAWATHKLGL
jgi:hypothetical protein